MVSCSEQLFLLVVSVFMILKDIACLIHGGASITSMSTDTTREGGTRL